MGMSRSMLKSATGGAADFRVTRHLHLVNGVFGFGAMLLQCRLKNGQLLVGFEATEAFGGLEHARIGPAQRHFRVSPALHVPADLSDHRVHGLDDVCRSQRAAQFGRQAEAGHGEDLLEALEDALRHAGRLEFEAAREVAQKTFGLVGIIELPGLAQGAADSGVMLGIEPLGDVARLVDLAALDRNVGAKGPADRLGQGLGAIHDEQPAELRDRARARSGCPATPARSQRSLSRLQPRPAGVSGRRHRSRSRPASAGCRPCADRRSGSPAGRASTDPKPSMRPCAPGSAP